MPNLWHPTMEPNPESFSAALHKLAMVVSSGNSLAMMKTGGALVMFPASRGGPSSLRSLMVDEDNKDDLTIPSKKGIGELSKIELTKQKSQY